jgi:Mrp family chromosome partitioning ATPase
MEKLQAALSRAREKRENETGQAYRPGQSARARSRKIIQSEALQSRWAEIPMFEPSAARMHDARIYASEVSPEAQHYDILRTKLFLEMRRNGWTRIAITSATSGCGKTTTACNLIAGLGRQPESKGILFDLDFRRPAVAKRFGVKPPHSLEQVLLGEVEFSEQAMRLNENTAISMTTGAVNDPARVILRSQTTDVLDQIQSYYKPELMLFDLPPVLVSDETRGFLKLVDAVLILASAETSTVAQIDEVESEIAQYSNVAGIVLNQCRYMDEGYGYAY